MSGARPAQDSELAVWGGGPVPDNPGGLNLAASWYAAVRTSELGRKPLSRRMFGRDLVLWRDQHGQPRTLPAHCPHQGAHLGLGKVVDGAVQCPFHHWRFGGDGRCVSIPHLDKIPGTAKLQPYPTAEAYGYVWVWYGTVNPLFDLPDFPPMTSASDDYVGFHYDDDTTGTVRHLLENAVDYQHFSALHGLDLDGIDYRVLTDPADAADNGAALSRRDAWFGVWFAGRPARPPVRQRPLTLLSAVISTFAMGERMELLVDGWPGGQRFTAYVDGQEVYKVLMGTVPVDDRRTRQVGWAGVRRTGRWSRTLMNLVLFWVQNRAGTWQDIPIYDSTRTAQPTVYVRYDAGLMRFRRYYQHWVEKAEHR